MSRAPGKRLLQIAAIIMAALAGLEITLVITLVILWRLGSQEVFDRVRRFNKRWLNPVVLAVAGRAHSPYAIIWHRGRRSGRMYATPVVAVPIFDGFIIPLAYGKAVDWYRNIQAANGCLLRWQGHTYTVSAPELLDASLAAPAFPLLWRLSMRVYGIKQFVKVSRSHERPGGPAEIERPRITVGV